MSILDFLRSKKNRTIKSEESAEGKVRRELLSRTYNRAYLFFGESDRTIEINGQTITYAHSECFIADKEFPTSIKRFIRLTGNNLTGNPVNVREYDPWKIDKYSGIIFYVEENGVKYKISSSECLDRSWLNDHYMTGYEVLSETDEYNTIKINQKLKNLAKQKSIDELFEK